MITYGMLVPVAVRRVANCYTPFTFTFTFMHNAYGMKYPERKSLKYTVSDSYVAAH